MKRKKKSYDFDQPSEHIFFVKLLGHTLFYKHGKRNLITFFFLGRSNWITS